MRRFQWIVFNLLLAGNICAQVYEDPGEKYANTITPEELKAHLSILAGDYFEGRETGTIGLVRAAEYISAEFQKCGVPPLKEIGGYYKEYPLIEYGWGAAVISDKKNVYGFLRDFYGYATSNNSFYFTAGEIVFLGYGIDDSIYSDYLNADVAGKVVLVAYGEPVKDGRSIFTNNETFSEWTTDWRKKVNAATKHKAKCILMVDQNFDKIAHNPQWVTFLEGNLLKLKSEYKPAEYCSNFFISGAMADQLLGKKKKQMKKSLAQINATSKPVHFSVSTAVNFNMQKTERLVFADNVLAFIEGTDLANEIIIVSAHYDHL